MANSKQNFLGLVKIEGIQTSAYNSLEKTGKLVFAHLWDSQSGDVKVNEKFIINANGVEYNIATADIFEALEARVAALEAWRPDVDSSIDRLDSSVSALESLLADYSEWKVSVDASIDALQAKDTEIDSSISDISSRLSTALASAQIASAAIADGSTLVTLTTTDKSNTVATSSFKVAGNGYVTLSGDANHINVAVTTASVEDTTVSGVGLADAGDVHNYVQGLIQDLEGALVYKGTVTSAEDLASKEAEAEVGDVWVAANAWTTGDPLADQGDMFIWNGSDWGHVERNLDQAVQATSSASFSTGSVMVGGGDHLVEASTISIADVSEAIDKSRTAVQTATASGDNYVTVDATVSDNEVTVNVNANVVDVSTATAEGEGLADAKDVKDYVDWKVDSIPEVEMTLDSSTPAYVTTSATVSDGAITATVGVITATLADASNGDDGLAMAKDVYDELTAVEEVMATANTTMANTLGLDSSFGVTWSAQSGIPATASYKEAIEGAYEEAHKAGVTSFGGKTGVIILTTNSETAGDVNFAMSQDGSTLSGAVVGWDALVSRVADVSLHANNNDASIADLSTNVIPGLVTRIENVSTHAIDNDASIADLSTKLATFTVKSIEGEVAIATRPNDEYVAVSASAPDADGEVSLDASVQLAEDVDLSGITGATAATATGLATDATVKDYVAYALAWEVIGGE